MALDWCSAFGSHQRSEMEIEPLPQPRRLPSALDVGKMVAVEYDEEAGLFHQRLILRTAPPCSIPAARCAIHLFWILTPDGDVYPELLQVPRATGFVWLNERNAPILTTMMPAGRRLGQVDGFGAHKRIQLSPEVIVRAVLGAQQTEDTCREAAATSTAPSRRGSWVV